MRILIGALAIVLMAASAALADVSEAKVQASIETGVEETLKCQQPAGSFALGNFRTEINGESVGRMPQGITGLALLTLEYARPRLKGDLLSRTDAAIHKGIGYLVQQPPEQFTYSAGTIVTMLAMADKPESYRRTVGDYATMLVNSQHTNGAFTGAWDYVLHPLPGNPGTYAPNPAWGDQSNLQFAILGLLSATRMGYQTPRSTWERARDHYYGCQNTDGGWGYSTKQRPQSSMNLTVASTISLNICDEMLADHSHLQCKPPEREPSVEAGMKWIAENMEKSKLGTDTYGLYAMERLGILTGRAEFGGHDWWEEGAAVYLRSGPGGAGASRWTTAEIMRCFGIIFLSRGLDPIIINKLARRDTNDWNNDPYDIKHLVEDLEFHHQVNGQWRIVTLDAPLGMLLKTPLLFINGHNKLNFTEDDKKKLKAYVDGGGTILGEACCSKKEFADSFRAFVAETFGGELRPLPAGHRIFERMAYKGSTPKPKIEFYADNSYQGRPSVLFLPTDYSCRWHVGGEGAHEAFAVGAGIYLYVVNEGRKMFLEAHPEAANPPPSDDTSKRKGKKAKGDNP